MARTNQLLLVLGLLLAIGADGARDQQPVDQLPAPQPIPASTTPPIPVTVPATLPCDRSLPINLPTALRLVGVRSLDVAFAAARIRVASAQLEQAKVLWLPTLLAGGDYLRHDGQLQDATSTLVLGNSHSSLMAGVGPSMVFAVTDAIFEPLAARQVVQARNAGAPDHDERYHPGRCRSVLQRPAGAGDLAGAEEATCRAEEVYRRAEQWLPAWCRRLKRRERGQNYAADGKAWIRCANTGVWQVPIFFACCISIRVWWSNHLNRPSWK